MTMKNLTADQLNNLDHEALVKMILSQQEEISRLDHTLQLFMEEVADAKRHRFGRSTESFEPDGQISFREIDGEFVFFNETEAVCDEEAEETPAPRIKPRRPSGKKEDDLRNLKVIKTTPYYMGTCYVTDTNVLIDKCKLP